jgi:hypothetical protein
MVISLVLLSILGVDPCDDLVLLLQLNHNALTAAQDVTALHKASPTPLCMDCVAMTSYITV